MITADKSAKEARQLDVQGHIDVCRRRSAGTSTSASTSAAEGLDALARMTEALTSMRTRQQAPQHAALATPTVTQGSESSARRCGRQTTVPWDSIEYQIHKTRALHRQKERTPAAQLARWSKTRSQTCSHRRSVDYRSAHTKTCTHLAPTSRSPRKKRLT